MFLLGLKGALCGIKEEKERQISLALCIMPYLAMGRLKENEPEKMHGPLA